jgi:glycosyltransferase involved in cell wall biosynthesis
MHKVLVVVPCYNEQERLATSDFERFVREHPDMAFIFVDDGSIDGTQAVLRALCRTAPLSFRLITLRRNAGKGEAVRRGMLRALEIPGVQYVGFWDADLATPLDVIPSFVQIHDEHPELVLVMGTRVRLLGRHITRHIRRHYTGRVFATAASVVLSLPVYDTQCGAKLFRVSAITRRILEERFEARWIFDVEILARMTRDQRLATGSGIEGLVCEVPLLEWHDVGGSKRRTRDYLDAMRDLFLIHHRYIRGLPPVPESNASLDADVCARPTTDDSQRTRRPPAARRVQDSPACGVAAPEPKVPDLGCARQK